MAPRQRSRGISANSTSSSGSRRPMRLLPGPHIVPHPLLRAPAVYSLIADFDAGLPPKELTSWQTAKVGDSELTCSVVMVMVVAGCAAARLLFVPLRPLWLICRSRQTSSTTYACRWEAGVVICVKYLLTSCVSWELTELDGKIIIKYLHMGNKDLNLFEMSKSRKHRMQSSSRFRETDSISS